MAGKTDELRGEADMKSASPPSASPWSYPIFRYIWVASVASNFGGLILQLYGDGKHVTLGELPGLAGQISAAAKHLERRCGRIECVFKRTFHYQPPR